MIQIYTNDEQTQFAICKIGDSVMRYETVKGILYPNLFKEYDKMICDSYESEIHDIIRYGV